MALVGEWIRRLGYLLRRRQHEEELRREMDAHRALLGDPQAFGNALRLRDEARDAWGWTWLDDFVQDTRFALRTLRRSPGFALAAVLTLALGIGANIGMFTFVDTLLLRPLYDRSDEVVGVYSRSTARSGGFQGGVSYPNYRDLREGTSGIFASLAAFSIDFVGVHDGERTRRTMASRVTASYFQTFGRPVALGRPFTPEEEALGERAGVVIVSHRWWQQRGADPDALGQIVWIDGDQFIVIGVAPEGFSGGSIPGPELWMPLGAGGSGRTRDAHSLSVVGRLRTGVSVETAAPALAAVTRRLEQAFPAENAGLALEISPPNRLLFFPGPQRGALTATLTLALMTMPAIVLLVACLNLIDLLLARGHVRRQEMAIRSSLGGRRGRLVRQLLTEGLFLAVAGGALGLLLATWASHALLATVYPVLPVELSLPQPGLDWRVLAATVGFTLAATLLSGAGPAWALTRRSSASDLKRQVGEEGNRKLGGIRIGKALVVGQVALSILLLATGGLFVMSALSAATADPGFRLDGGLLVQVDPDLAGYDEARGRQAHRALVDRLRTLPGVHAVSIGSSVPFSGFESSRIVAPAGTGGAGSRTAAIFSVVGRDYARALGLSMLGGRDFTEAELAPGAGEPVAIIDDALAERLWPGEAALGRLIRFLDAEGAEAGPAMRVVGLMPAVNHSLGNPRPSPHVYVPLGQAYESNMTLQVRLAGGQAEHAMPATIARVIRDLDERVPVLRVETWRDHLGGGIMMWIYRTGAWAFSAFGAIALLLAVVGVYGVKSYVVSRRTREFGIRIATGAAPRALLWQVLREGSRTTAVGAGIGVLLALGAGRLLQGLLYGVEASEPIVLVAAPLILLAASLLASYIPARRATHVDPTVALRAE